jgi:hypothetical protein
VGDRVLEDLRAGARPVLLQLWILRPANAAKLLSQWPSVVCVNAAKKTQWGKFYK